MTRHASTSAILWAALLLLLALLPGAASASWLAAADSLYAAASASYDAGDYPTAARRYAETVLHIEGRDQAARSPYTQRMLADARFLMGRCHEHLKEWKPAIGAYSRSMTELPEIQDLVEVRLGRCYREIEDLDAAAAMYRLVVDGEGTILYLEAVEGLGDCYREAGNLDMALQWYRVFACEADGYDARARAEYKIGLVHTERGEDEAAEASFAAAVDDFPRSPFAYDALTQARLLSRSFTDRYHQGLVLYNRGEYRQAADYFTYHLRHEATDASRADAAYFLARCHQRLGHLRTAADRYRDVIEAGVVGENYDLAWQRLAYCLRVMDRIDESLETYDEYVRRHPERGAAADALWEKARLLEEIQRWVEAGDAFRELAERYPTSERASDALFRAGLCSFKLGEYEKADAWFAGLFVDSEDEEAARALFWSGKSTEALGRPQEAVIRYREAFDAARDSFYGRRALARLRALGAAPDDRRQARSTPSNGDPPRRIVGGTGEFQDFAIWLGTWYRDVYVPAGRTALREELASRPEYVRGDTFLALRMRDLAMREFTLVEDAIDGDPRLLDILCSYYQRVGLYMRAVRLAERILAVSPAEGVSDAPIYLRKEICPAYFDEIVAPFCDEYGIDESLFFSLIRQESVFEPGAVSWVGARGLSQIMPATGRWIAGKLGVRSFRTSQLLDPATNVHFGTYYLSLQIADFGGDILRALAAYNAGPESTDRWWGYGGGRDSDVFVEDIGYAQTADYVRRVYLYAELYRDTYGSFGGD